MSKNGDVVWANKQTWQRCYIDYPNNTEVKRKWYSTILDDFRSLKELKKLEDFRWLVKNGKIITQYELNPDDYVVAKKPAISETLRKEFVEDTLDKVRPEIHRIFEAACREARDEGYEQGWIQGNRHWTQEEKEAVTEFLSKPVPPQPIVEEYQDEDEEASFAESESPVAPCDLDDNDNMRTAKPAFLFYGFPSEESFGRHQERTAIIEYIRSADLTSGVHQTGAWLAAAIEAGTHLKTDDE